MRAGAAALAFAIAVARNRIIGVAVLVALSCGYGALTVARERDWRSDRTLFEHEIATPPYSGRSAVDLAQLVEGDDPLSAEQLYREAEAMTPDAIGLHLAYGTYLLKRGDGANAARCSELLLAIDPSNAKAQENMERLRRMPRRSE